MALRTPFGEVLAGLVREPFLPLGALALVAMLALLAPTGKEVGAVERVAGAVTTMMMICEKAIVYGIHAKG